MTCSLPRPTRLAARRRSRRSTFIFSEAMDHPPPAALKKFLRPYDKQVQDLALRLRALLLAEMAPCYENIYDAYSAVAIGYDNIFHIAVYSQHVNLGFNEGATLEDPKGILIGDGKRIRH